MKQLLFTWFYLTFRFLFWEYIRISINLTILCLLYVLYDLNNHILKHISENVRLQQIILLILVIN